MIRVYVFMTFIEFDVFVLLSLAPVVTVVAELFPNEERLFRHRRKLFEMD